MHQRSQWFERWWWHCWLSPPWSSSWRKGCGFLSNTGDVASNFSWWSFDEAWLENLHNGGTHFHSTQKVDSVYQSLNLNTRHTQAILPPWKHCPHCISSKPFRVSFFIRHEGNPETGTYKCFSLLRGIRYSWWKFCLILKWFTKMFIQERHALFAKTIIVWLTSAN